MDALMEILTEERAKRMEAEKKIIELESQVLTLKDSLRAQVKQAARERAETIVKMMAKNKTGRIECDCGPFGDQCVT